MKRFMSGIITGIILSIIAYFIVGMVTKIERKEIVVDHEKISGEDIIHHDVKIKRGVLEFKTTSMGKGKSKTKITIPHKKHIIQGGFVYDDKNKVSFNYLYSFNSGIAFGGGVIVSRDRFEGVQLLGQIKL